MRRMYGRQWGNVYSRMEIPGSYAAVQPKRNRKRKKNFNGNWLAAIWVAMVVASLGAVVYIGSSPLRERDLKYQEREAFLQQQYNRELERAEELEQQEAYVHTVRYIEETARQKLGLVKPGEILLVPVPKE